MPSLKIWNGTSWDIVGGVPGGAGPTGPGGGSFVVTLGGNTLGAMAQVSSGTLTLAGGAGISLSQAGNAITIVGGGGGGHNVTLGGNSTSAGAGYVQISTGTMTLAGGANIILSQNGNAITIAQTEVTRSLLFEGIAQSFMSHGNGSIHLQPVQVRGPITATEFDWIMSGNFTTSGSGTVSAWAGLYDVINSTSLALLSSGSVSYTMQVSNSTLYHSVRQWSMPFNVNASRGDYALGLIVRSSGGGSWSVFGASTQAFQGPAGVAANATYKILPFLGMYTSSSVAMPANVVAASIIGAGGASASAARRFDYMFRVV